jgi:acyl-CoA reductase-like NAD-dependent aldehyde dehydrogenase
METPFQTTSETIASFSSFNPATGDKIGDFGIATESEVRGAVTVAKFAQEKWAREPISRRIAVIRRFVEVLAARQDEVASLITAEAGKPTVEALTTEILVALDAARFCAEHVYQVLREEPVSIGNPAMLGKTARLVYEPVGVVGIIAPWNYPFSIPAVDALAALVVGNGVVIKPSELTPASAHKLQAILIEAGLPAGLLQVVDGFGETGAALISAGVDKIIFTGSVPTGRRVAAACAERLVSCILELGGKDAMLVLDDADLEAASSAAVWGSMMNAGQTCISVERCLVHRSIYDKFLDACVDKVRKLRVGNGADCYVDVGPMISQRQLEIVERQICHAVENGAHAICGGHRLPELGPNFFAPTVITNVSASASLWCEETFGPVLAIAAFDSDLEAIARANASEFGLSASVWTPDRSRGERVARQIQAGAVLVNDLLTSFGISEAPHGGVKASGIGRTHGMYGMREMVRPKFLAVEKFSGMKQLWWYNYTPEMKMQMSGFVDMLFGRGLIARIRGALRSTGSLFRRRL